MSISSKLIAILSLLCFCTFSYGNNGDCLTKLQQAKKNLFSTVAERPANESIAVLRCADNIANLAAEHQLLAKATVANKIELVAFLLKAGADANIEDRNKVTPIMLAAMRGFHDIVVSLLNHGAALDKRANNGYAAFDYALETQQIAILQTIVNQLIQQKLASDNALGHWLQGNKSAISAINPATQSLLLIQQLLAEPNSELEKIAIFQHGINSHNDTRYAALPLAVRLNYSAIVNHLLQLGANPNIGNDNEDEAIPLNQATRGGHLALAKQLITAGADVNKQNGRGYTALMLAAMYGNVSFGQFLLANQADTEIFNNKGSNALMMAAAYGQAELATSILKRSSNLTVANKQGFTAMDYAMQRGDAATVIALLTAAGQGELISELLTSNQFDWRKIETDVNHVMLGFPLLHIASRFNRIESALQLIDLGANVNAQSDSGFKTTALMEASRGNAAVIAQALLKLKIDVNSQDSFGDSAINWATAYGHLEIVDLLLQHGANPQLANNFGDTAVSTAKFNGNVELLKRLQQSNKGQSLTTDTSGEE